jgi:glycogen phosphorylase
VRALRRFTVRAQLPTALAPLQSLATNLRWSWHQPTQDLFASLDHAAGERAGHDPVRLLGEMSSARISELAADDSIVATVRELAADLDAYLSEPRWYQGARDADSSLPAAVGYFSM